MNELHVIVVNNGAQAASIANVGVRSDDRSSNVDLVFLRDNDAQVAGRNFPREWKRTVRWNGRSPTKLLASILRGSDMRGYAHRYQSVRLKRWPKHLQRGPIRTHESAGTRRKN